MSSGPSNVTSTTNTEPPEFLQGPLEDVARAAQSGFNPNGQGSQLLGQSQDVLGQTIQGDFLDPNTNPFLQGTFDRAADLTQTRLSSEFAGAGRDLGASFPARSEELQTLASNIFGGNFQAERGRQMDAIGQSQMFDPTNLFINRLAGIIPGAGGSTQATQPVFKTGLF